MIRDVVGHEDDDGSREVRESGRLGAKAAMGMDVRSDGLIAVVFFAD